MGISEAIGIISKLQEKHRIISETAAQMENDVLAKDHGDIAEAIETVIHFILTERRAG